MKHVSRERTTFPSNIELSHRLKTLSSSPPPSGQIRKILDRLATGVGDTEVKCALMAQLPSNSKVEELVSLAIEYKKALCNNHTKNPRDTSSQSSSYTLTPID